MAVATEWDAMREFARNTGSARADRQWILTDYDVWVTNPHYCGPAQRHPEDDQGYDEPPVGAELAPKGWDFVEGGVMSDEIPF